jgi:hypothetical protein
MDQKVKPPTVVHCGRQVGVSEPRLWDHPALRADGLTGNTDPCVF